jgi:tetratricopeptide (TPR) repeat protein
MTDSIPNDLNSLSDLPRLMGLLRAHDDARRGSKERRESKRRFELVEGCCLALIAGPLELGTASDACPFRARAGELLGDPAYDELPEAKVCRLWLSCVESSPPGDLLEPLTALADASLWEPVWALAVRTLAYFGRRDVLKRLAQRDMAASCYRDELGLEVPYVGGPVTLPVEYKKQTDRLLNSEFLSDWSSLLRAEYNLAAAKERIESGISQLMVFEVTDPPKSYMASERRRIGVRAAAAVVRDRITQRRDAADVLNCPACTLMPQWEKDYLTGLGDWVVGRREKALGALQSAIRRNPHQSCVRFALATMQAQEDPAAALAHVEPDDGSIETLVAKVVLLIRTGRPEKAAEVLQSCSVETAGFLPLRYSWPAGRQYYENLLQALRTAFCERLGDWHGAHRQLQAARTQTRNGFSKNLNLARTFFVVAQEAKSQPSRNETKLAELERSVKRTWHEIRNLPLSGPALFFRAAGALERRPLQATRDFQALLRQRAWIDAECQIGSARQVFVGDALMRLGDPQGAIEAYSGVKTVTTADVRDRLAVAQLWNLVKGSNSEAEIRAGITKLDRAASRSGWVGLSAALVFALIGDAEEANHKLKDAEELGASGRVLHDVRLVCAVLSGGPSAASRDSARHGGKETISDVNVRLMNMKAVAFRCVKALCDEGAWDRAVAVSERRRPEDGRWVIQLRVLAALSRALARAENEPEGAERAIRDLELTMP